MKAVMPNPCFACPYRRDVSSGIWAPEEYDKLLEYDKPTGEQPMAPFACHASPEKFCHGWAVCHSNRGHDKELIALRLQGIGTHDLPVSKIPLFGSGQEAADHGKTEILKPGSRAKKMILRLMAKHWRLRKGN